MQFSIEIPEDILCVLRERWGDLSASALELIALEAYRTYLLDAGQVSRLLGFERPDEFLSFLRKVGPSSSGEKPSATAKEQGAGAPRGAQVSLHDLLNPIPDLSDSDAQAFARSILQLREWDRQRGVRSAELL